MHFLVSVPFKWLTARQKTLVGSWLEKSSAVGNYKLCWSSSKHIKDFHSQCDGKPHTITIAKIRHTNKIYGGYTDVAWRSKSQFNLFSSVKIKV